jgi:hypothetical protein
MICSERDVVVRRRIRRSEPTLDVLLQLVACRAVLVLHANQRIKERRTFHLVHFISHFLHGN